MKVKTLIKELEKIKKIYGDVEVTIFDPIAYDNGLEKDTATILEVDYSLKRDEIVIY